MISNFFIERPIFASVIAIVIVLAGAVSLSNLPIAQYPEISPPVITISASYPGASADIVSENVAAPIELQVNGADNMIYMTSTASGTGSLTIRVYFEIGTDPDMAQVDVQNRVNIAMPMLPESVVQQGVIVQKVSSSFLMIIGIYSPDERFDKKYIANYANLYVLEELKRIPGANQTSILGMPDYAMRVWIKPDRMAQLGITTSDIKSAVSKQNQQYAVGQIGKAPTNKPVEQTFSIVTTGMLKEPEEFGNIILRAGREGAIVRLKDVATVELGMQDYSVRTRMNGRTATFIAVYQQPGANAVNVSDDVRATLERLKKSFPDGIDYKISMDTTDFVRASIKEVLITFLEACFLVIIVVFIFLQSFRVTIIPILAIPVSIIGTATGMLLFGFSINMLTLFGLILAIGIVVDDAIVVVENVERNMREMKLSAKDASKKAMEEVTGPIIATSLVLCAVFVPVAFLGGMTGQLYKQFAVTIAVSVVLSTIMALTLTPAMAAILLEQKHKKKTGFFIWFENGFENLTRAYVKTVNLLITNPLKSLLFFTVILCSAIYLFRTIPTSFVPVEDQGYIFGISSLPDSSSLDRTEKVNSAAGEIFASHPAVKDVSEVDGFSLVDSQTKTDAGALFISLKGFEKRKSKDLTAQALIQKTLPGLAGIKEGLVFPVNPPSLPGLGNMGGFEFWILNHGEGDTAKLAEITNHFVAKSNKQPELQRVSSSIQPYSQQLFVDVEREKAETLRIPIDSVYDVLHVCFGSAYVSQFTRFGRLWQVIIQADAPYRSKPEDLNYLYVRSDSGNMVPLKSVVTTSYQAGPDIVTRFNNFPAAKVIGNAAPGFSSGQAITAMEHIAADILPSDFGFAWSGEAFEEKKAGGTSSMIFLFGLVMVFLILAAQYEKWSLPLGVLMAVPFALFGALMLIMIRGIENDIYFQIGLLTLIALAAKNAILITEFAVQKHKEGMSLVDAALEAARLRLRPIIMTSMAFILGCIPLAIATGASANSRHSIGTGVIGGMIAATFIAVFFIPLFFVLFEKLGSRGDGKRGIK